ncbi:MAG: helix-turn-helix domain-containing protein [Alphaproteobacteria bacterium]|nr:helix-turn-helix domain-containing protein [Alphaproteobacteria bacterium]MBU0799280.1 helix-turn-helix domain-containing protein [Alphaproteobacteria bacterium]MBU0888877.1 helix-turn-helix domain-containing protein [Alphaproteobacteria bacterium]MBU1813897.1 helix-turn-helix domain-containing protein [Alphaproteobacteria bacterium]
MSNLGDELIQSMQEALDHSKGQRSGLRVTKVEIRPVDVVAIRKRLGLPQTDFAALLGVSVSGLRKWEQGQRQPTGAARTLLHVMEKEPDAVRRVTVKAAE